MCDIAKELFKKYKNITTFHNCACQKYFKLITSSMLFFPQHNIEEFPLGPHVKNSNYDI